MTRKLPLLPISTCLYFVLMGPLLAAQAANTDATSPPATENEMTAAKSADVCRDDLKTFTVRWRRMAIGSPATAIASVTPWARRALECMAECTASWAFKAAPLSLGQASPTGTRL